MNTRSEPIGSTCLKRIPLAQCDDPRNETGVPGQTVPTGNAAGYFGWLSPTDGAKARAVIRISELECPRRNAGSVGTG